MVRRLFGLGSRDAQKMVKTERCANCNDILGMRPDWKEIRGRKYCNRCAKKS